MNNIDNVNEKNTEKEVLEIDYNKITSAKIRRVVGWTNRPAPTDDSYLWYNSSS